MVDVFYKLLNRTILELIPMKKTATNKYPPWYSRDLIRLLREKYKYHVRFKKYKNPLDQVSFEELRDECNALSSTCYKKYIGNIENGITKNPKLFWSFIKNKRKGSSTYPAQMSLNNKIAVGGREICNMFGEMFASTFSVPDDTYPSLASSPRALTSAALCNLQFDSEEIYRELAGLDETKGAGSDGIPPIFIKRCAKALASPLQTIFNRSLRDGTFPSTWKEALVIPIFKSGEKHLVANYRPISILITFGKVFEKLISKHLMWYLKQHITEHQHGFVKSRSTNTNLLCFTSVVSKSLDRRIPVDAIYTDFSKAFDKVDHYLLILKLAQLGIGGTLVEWFKSYLDNRWSKVVMNGHTSESYAVTSGIPQGSHLGPILFNIFINDITECFKHSHFYLFADDLKIMKPIQSNIDSKMLQEDVDRLVNWCKHNKMLLNISKCHYIQFTRNKKMLENKYYIEGVEVKKLSSVRDLGVQLDEALKFDVHILNTVSKSFKVLGFVLRNSKEFKKSSTKIKLFNTLVRPILEYGSVVWSPHYEVYIKRIESVQKRFLYHLCYGDYLAKQLTSYNERLRHYNMNTLASRRKTLDFVILHKIMNGTIDCSELLGLLPIQIPTRIPRHNTYNLFNIACSKTNLGHYAAVPRLCRQYNMSAKTTDLDICARMSKYKKCLKNIN
uniref:Reverse transcriptase domain-containing protein n=1 Tax=Heliothis virescens TaxID=7102 RepID=A0A2A4JB85_HELVI